MERKESDMPKANLMTQQTKERLEREHEDIKAKLFTVGQSIGEAAGPNMDWHDNPAFDYAQMEFKTLGVQELAIEEKLRYTQIVEPRQEIDVVGIGNSVVVRFANMDEDEEFVVLGPDDGVTGKDFSPRWISSGTPLAQSLIGKTKGEVATMKLGDGLEQEIKVKDIKPGKF